MVEPSTGRKTIKSHEEFRKLLPRLLAQQDERPDLARAALANPILALEELGYRFAPEIRLKMERLARFGEERAAEIERIETRLAEALGPEVDVADPAALAAAVVARLPEALLAEEVRSLPAQECPPAGSGQTGGPNPHHPRPERITVREHLAAVLPYPPQRRFDTTRQPEDALAPLKGRAALLDDVIRLREIEGSRARLAEPRVFHGILDGEIRTPITRVRFLPSDPPRPEGG